MSLATFVHPGVAAAEVGQQLLLDGSEGHHAATVRRTRRNHSSCGASTLHVSIDQ